MKKRPILWGALAHSNSASSRRFLLPVQTGREHDFGGQSFIFGQQERHAVTTEIRASHCNDVRIRRRHVGPQRFTKRGSHRQRRHGGTRHCICPSFCPTLLRNTDGSAKAVRTATACSHERNRNPGVKVLGLWAFESQASPQCGIDSASAF